MNDPSPMNRRDFLHTSASLAATALSAHGQSHHHVNEAPFEAAASPAGATGSESPILSGTGEFRYQYVPEKLVLPPEVKMKNGHGLYLDTAGNIYFTFETEKVEDHTRCLVRFAPDGTGATLLGADNGLAHGVPHGLN